MSKDLLIPEQIEDITIPKLRIDTHQISKLVDSEAMLKSYHELFVKYLQTIANEPSPTKKQYYGHYLEGIIDKIQTDRSLEGAKSTRDKIIQKIASYIDVLADKQNISLIADKTQTILEAGQTQGFHESAKQLITEQISKYLKGDLNFWAESKKDAELIAEFKDQEAKLVFDRSIPTNKMPYISKGGKFWEDCLSLTEKFFLPKSIDFNITKESKKYHDSLKKEKNPFITGVLNTIKIGLGNNRSAVILSKQIQDNICSFDPNARIAQIMQILGKLLKKLFNYLRSKINI